MHSLDEPPIKNRSEERKKYKRFVSKHKGQPYPAWSFEFERWLIFHFNGTSPKVLHRSIEVIPAPHTCKKGITECFACEHKLKPNVVYLVDIELERGDQRVTDYYRFSQIQFDLFVKAYVKNNPT